MTLSKNDIIERFVLLARASILAIMIAVAIGAFWTLCPRPRQERCPLLPAQVNWWRKRQEFLVNGPKVIEEGFKSTESGVFRVIGINGRELYVISPQRWLTLCAKRDNEISPARQEFFYAKYTGSALEEDLLYKLVQAQMPTFDRNLPEIASFFDRHLESVIDAESSLDKERNSKEFMPVKVARIVVNMFGCALWKLILRDSYTEDIVPIFCSYSSAIFAAQMKFRRRHPILLPVTAPFCSDVYRARTHLHEAMHLLSPAFRQARHKAQTQNGMDIAIIGWILRNVDEDRYYDDEYLAKLLLAYGIAFIFAASPTGSGIVTEAAFRPDLCSLIREEALRINDLDFTKASLQQLTILDSFCKETHKHYPNAASNLMKKVHQDLDLGDGIKLRKETILEVVIQASNLSNPNFDQPAEWDGLRYHNLRQQAGSNEKIRRQYEWGAVAPDDLSFGYGSHQCPDRLTGCNMLKMLLLKIIQKYDLRPPEGQAERHKDETIGQYYLMDFERTVLMRRRP